MGGEFGHEAVVDAGVGGGVEDIYSDGCTHWIGSSHSFGLLLVMVLCGWGEWKEGSDLRGEETFGFGFVQG